MSATDMKWTATKEKLPSEKSEDTYVKSVPYLVVYQGEVCILVWNPYHFCWDDESGDDWKCDPYAVSHYMPLPGLPQAAGGE